MSSPKTLFRSFKQETRADITDRAAREIIEAETAARLQQTVRLRSARLRKEAVERTAERSAVILKQRKVAR